MANRGPPLGPSCSTIQTGAGNLEVPLSMNKSKRKRRIKKHDIYYHHFLEFPPIFFHFFSWDKNYTVKNCVKIIWKMRVFSTTRNRWRFLSLRSDVLTHAPACSFLNGLSKGTCLLYLRFITCELITRNPLCLASDPNPSCPECDAYDNSHKIGHMWYFIHM